MATENEKSELSSNIISGKILIKELGKGIPNLLVVLFDLDNWLDPEVNDGSIFERSAIGLNTTSTSSSLDISELFQMGDRIGSTLTDSVGEFLFEVSLKDFNLPPKKIEQKPDLILLVLAPEEPGLDLNSRLLYLSNEIRLNAGTKEAYIIKLSNELLAKKGVNLEQSDHVENKITTYIKTLEDDKKYNAAVFNIEKENIKIKQSDLATYKSQFKELLTPIPIISVDSNYSTYIKEDEKVLDKLEEHTSNELSKTQQAITKHIENHKGIEVTFVLTEGDITDLGIDVLSEESKHFSDIEKTEPLKSLLNKMNAAGGDNLVLTTDNPILKKCLKKSDDTLCATNKLGMASNGGNANQDNRIAIHFNQLPEAAKRYLNGNYGGEARVVAIFKLTDKEGKQRYEVSLLANILLHFDNEGLNTDDTTPLTSEEISNYVKKVITDIRSIKKSANNTTGKPDQDSVNQNVNSFNLKKGPAELPSFYDFKVLNIAFGHIWQQLIDDQPAQLAAELKSIALNRGYTLSNTYTSAGNMLADFTLICSTFSNPPESVISNFDITYEEWNALELLAKTKLTEICTAINKAMPD